MENLISIIIPVHNSSKYLSKCLDSIINGTYKNIEIIAIENGSTDNSLEILNRYKDKIRIEILKEANLGGARNKGIELSKGQYLSFIDSDDFLEPTFLDDLLTNLKENKSDISMCNIKEFHEETSKIIDRNDYPNKTITKEEILNNLDKFDYGPCNKLYKKEIITKNNLRFRENLKYEDLPFVLGYIEKSSKISKVNKNLYNYVIHKESEQTTIDERIFDIIEIMNICKMITTKENLENLYIKTLTTYALKTRHIKNNNLRKKFINEIYKNLNNTYPNWKKSNYIKSRSTLKIIIQKSKKLTSIYTFIYSHTH